jgi:predicted transcriptional regulator
MTIDELITQLSAFDHPMRLRIIAALTDDRVHVSELARRLSLSRPLLYMHLDKLEKAGIVRGELELADTGRAMKYFELEPFELMLTATEVARIVRDNNEEETQL